MGGQNCNVVVDVDNRIFLKIVGIRNRIISVGLNEKDALRLGGPKRSGDPITILLVSHSPWDTTHLLSSVIIPAYKTKSASRFFRRKLDSVSMS